MVKHQIAHTGLTLCHGNSNTCTVHTLYINYSTIHVAHSTYTYSTCREVKRLLLHCCGFRNCIYVCTRSCNAHRAVINLPSNMPRMQISSFCKRHIHTHTQTHTSMLHATLQGIKSLAYTYVYIHTPLHPQTPACTHQHVVLSHILPTPTTASVI